MCQSVKIMCIKCELKGNPRILTELLFNIFQLYVENGKFHSFTNTDNPNIIL